MCEGIYRWNVRSEQDVTKAKTVQLVTSNNERALFNGMKVFLNNFITLEVSDDRLKFLMIFFASYLYLVFMLCVIYIIINIMFSFCYQS